jgi:hypothetical protein
VPLNPDRHGRTIRSRAGRRQSGASECKRR